MHITAGIADVLILGVGGHARVVADVIRALGGGVVGACGVDASRVGEVFEPGGAEVITHNEALFADLDAFMRGREIRHAVVALGDNAIRATLSEALGDYLAPPLLHPRATISPSAEVGPGSVALPRVVVNAAAEVGRDVILNTGCVIEHDCVIGAHVHVSPGAAVCGEVVVGEGAWIGANATVIPGVRVGAGAIVGAGAVVIRDVGEGETVVGSPARVVKRSTR